MPSVADVTHLLRRTEFVARPARVAELAALPDIGAAVDNVLAVPGNPPSVQWGAPVDSLRVVELTDFWFDRMAHDSPRPIQERMALFWHGHFVSSNAKVGNLELMRRQIDLYRAQGLGNFRDLAIQMSTTAAMLRYLDNNQNYIGSPNQNFGRELMELFVLGVGNYTEDDVVACSEAWTGHTDIYRPDVNGQQTQYDHGVSDYAFHGFAHEPGTRTLLGRTINAGADPSQHGAETIRTMLGDPASIGGVNPAGRPTREVAADFISTKLWRFFAGPDPSATVLAALRQAAIGGDFDLKPWLRALLTHPEFYSSAVKQGLVRAPTDYLVALLAASGLRSTVGNPWWLLDGMGQRLLFPPNVSGWGHNGAWIGASGFGRRAAVAQHVAYYVLGDYWDGAGMRLATDVIPRSAAEEAEGADARRAFVSRILAGMQISVGSVTRAALDEFAVNAAWHELHDVVQLIFVSPEMSLA